MKGVFLDRASVDRGDIDFARLDAALPDWTWHESTRPEDVAERVVGAAVVVSNKVPVTAEVIAAAGELRLIVVAATGTNNVDLDAAAKRDIPVCNSRDYGTPSVVQHTLALMMALAVQLPAYRTAVAAGRWQTSDTFCLLDFPIVELAGRVLGIVGFGNLGRGVADAASALGMDVRIAQRPGGEPQPNRVPLAELLPTVDVLSLHCPLTEHTRGLIGEAELRAMKPSAFLINTARGALVDEAALARALRDGVIAGAGVDVLSREPPVSGNPLLEADIPNLIVTPHIAWAGRDSRQRLVDDIAANIEAFVAGTPRNRVA